jgi:hypothetical protein
MRGGGHSRVAQKGGYTPQDIKILRKYHMGEGQELEEIIDEDTKQAFLKQQEKCMKNGGTKTVMNKNCWAVSRVLRELLLRDIRAENSQTDVIRVHVKPQQSIAIHVIADDVEYEELEDDDESPVNKGVGTGNNDSNTDSTGSSEGNSESNSNSNTASTASSEGNSESNSNSNTASTASSEGNSESNSNSNTASTASSESNSNSNTVSTASSEDSSESNSNSNASSIGSSTPLAAPVPTPTPTASSTQPTIVTNPLQAVAAATASVPAAAPVAAPATTQPVIVPNPLQAVAAATAAAPAPEAGQPVIVPNPLQAVKSTSRQSIPPPPVPSPAVVVKNPVRNITPKIKKNASNNTKRAGKNKQPQNQTLKVVKNPLVKLGVINPRSATAPAGKQNTSRNKIKISKPFNAKPAFTIGSPTLTNIRGEKLSRNLRVSTSRLRSQIKKNPTPTNTVRNSIRNTYANIKTLEPYRHLSGQNAMNIVKRAEAKYKSTQQVAPNTNARVAFNPLAVTRKRATPRADTGVSINPELQTAMNKAARVTNILTKPLRNGVSEEDVNVAVAQLGGSKTKRRTRRASHRRRR